MRYVMRYMKYLRYLRYMRVHEVHEGACGYIRNIKVHDGT